MKKVISGSQKSDNKLYVLVYAVCTFLMTSCSLYCLISSFSLNVDSFALLFCTALFTIGFAILSTLVNSNRKYATCVGAIFAVIVVVVLFIYDKLMSELNYVVNTVLKEYCKYLDFPQRVSFAGFANEATLFFVALSLLMCFLLTFFLIRVRRTIFAIIIPIIVIIPCFVLVNTLPDLLPLMALITVLLTLFASSYFCRINAFESALVVPVVAVIMAVFVAVVYVLNPTSSYRRREWQDGLLSQASSLLSIENHSVTGSPLIPDIKDVEKELDLSQIGPLEQTHTKVMTVDSAYNGIVYLRGYCYANYNNNKWSLLKEEQAQLYPNDFNSFLMTDSDKAEYTLSIETERYEGVIYAPYFLSRNPAYGTPLVDILIKNEDSVKKYYNSFFPYTVNEAGYDYTLLYSYKNEVVNTEEYINFVYNNYLNVPQDVLEEMRLIIEENDLHYKRTEDMANSVREFVSNSASYSLSTPFVPQDKDLALWLLNESETGYCVHFATAATVMLRSAGIPARYVSGYIVELDSDNKNSKVVTTDNAHAWVEYFDDEIGWVPLDATPSDFSVPEYTPQAEQDNQPDTEHNTEPKSSTENEITSKQNNVLDSENTVLVSFVSIASALLLLVLALLVRRKIVLVIRHKSFTSGSNNKRAKYIYKYLLKLMKHLEVSLPKQVNDIVDKARFSGRQISKDELCVIAEFVALQTKELQTDIPTDKKLYLKYILALI